jgi:hypothetical protein
MDRVWSLGKPLNQQEDSSLTAVVYGMVQTRKKQTLGSSLSVPSSRAGSGRAGKLSVTFSLRRKSRKAEHKLQRIASENPNLQKRKRKQGNVLMPTASSSSYLSDSQVCYSSPDVREREAIENSLTQSPAVQSNSEIRVNIE